MQLLRRDFDRLEARLEHLITLVKLAAVMVAANSGVNVAQLFAGP